jgi:hypothetical protein
MNNTLHFGIVGGGRLARLDDVSVDGLTGGPRARQLIDVKPCENVDLHVDLSGGHSNRIRLCCQ